MPSPDISPLSSAICQPGEIRALTGLRGVAALYVVFYHLGAIDLAAGHAQVFFRHGYLAVDLFFVLSGYIMAMNYGQSFARHIAWRDVRTFLARRVARIYPLYLVLLPIGFCQSLPYFLARYGAAGLPGVTAAQLALVQSWGISRSFIVPAWSISAEWAAYMLFPLLCYTAATATRRSILIGLLTCALLITLVAMRPGQPDIMNNGPLDAWSGDSWGPLARCLPEFALGFLTFLTADWPVVRNACLPRGVSLLLLSGIVALLCLAGSDVAAVLGFALLILSLGDDRSHLARLLASRPVYRLGVLSYAIYLLHHFFAPEGGSVVHTAHPWLLIGGKLLAIFIFASLAHEFIEKPGRRFCRRLLEPHSRMATEKV